MRQTKKAAKIQEILTHLYPSPPIPLNYQDPYTLLVAVVLSAQCTDIRVNLVTTVLFKKANTPKKMKTLGKDSVQEIIKSCGLSNNKSKALIGLSELILQNYGGIVPQTFEELESLPGVGHKTASVVMAQAFGVPAFPVDTHIHRLATRWKLTSGKSVIQTEKDLKKAFPKDTWNLLHLQFIYFGREHCPARNHDPKKCPICSWAAL